MASTNIADFKSASFLSNAFGNVNYSDLIIRCKGREWNVHRVVICTQCSYFEDALNSGMKEAESGIIEFPEDEPVMVDTLLGFFYRRKYKIPAEYSNPFKFEAQLYAIAEKYNVEALMLLILENFQSRATNSWSASNFTEAAGSICQNTFGNTEGMLNVVAQIICANMAALLKAYKDNPQGLSASIGIGGKILQILGDGNQYITFATKGVPRQLKCPYQICAKEWNWNLPWIPDFQCPFCKKALTVKKYTL